MRGIPENASADVMDCTLERPQPVMEAKRNANNNHNVISHKTPVNSIAKGYQTQDSAEDRTYTKTTVAGEMFDKEAKSSSQNVHQQSEKTISGSGMEEFDKPIPNFLDTQQHSPPVVPIISIPNNESTQDTIHRAPTPSTFDQEKHNFDSSFGFFETLDLAGALPQQFPETRTFTYVRRSSTPANISTLVCSSLANLSLGEETSTNIGENHSHCVEYSGPMPSPADAPSSKETAHYFPSEVEKDLVSATVIPCQKESYQQACKEVEPNSPQKKLPEKKGSPVKTTTILEKAVISGVKPDRLRIPLSSSKDRLSEFRLESGLPDDLKIQVIPEVDIEKDPSREASPIPPDNSFTFNVTESGGKAPPTSALPKSPTEKRLEDATKQASIDGLSEVTVNNGSGAQCTNNKKTESGEGFLQCYPELSQQDYAPQIVHSESVQITEIDGRKLNKQPGNIGRPEKTAEDLIVARTLRGEDPQSFIDCAVMQSSSVEVIEPQVQAEKEAGREKKIKIEEEVVEEAEILRGTHQIDDKKPTTEEVRVTQSVLENLESKAKGRSDGNQVRSDPATNTVPHIDQQSLAEYVEGAHIKEDNGREETRLDSPPRSKEQGNIPKDDHIGTQENEGAGAMPAEEPRTRSTNINDTDRGLLKLQGT